MLLIYKEKIAISDDFWTVAACSVVKPTLKELVSTLEKQCLEGGNFALSTTPSLPSFNVFLFLFNKSTSYTRKHVILLLKTNKNQANKLISGKK